MRYLVRFPRPPALNSKFGQLCQRCKIKEGDKEDDSITDEVADQLVNLATPDELELVPLVELPNTYFDNGWHAVQMALLDRMPAEIRASPILQLASEWQDPKHRNLILEGGGCEFDYGPMDLKTLPPVPLKMKWLVFPSKVGQWRGRKMSPPAEAANVLARERVSRRTDTEYLFGCQLWADRFRLKRLTDGPDDLCGLRQFFDDTKTVEAVQLLLEPATVRYGGQVERDETVAIVLLVARLLLPCLREWRRLFARTPLWDSPTAKASLSRMLLAWCVNGERWFDLTNWSANMCALGLPADQYKLDTERKRICLNEGTGPMTHWVFRLLLPPGRLVTPFHLDISPLDSDSAVLV